MDVITLGELLVDMFPAELGKSLAEVSAFHPKPGGAPANVAVAVMRLGKRSAFLGKVGDDAFGRHLVDVLAQEGVDVSAVRFDPQARTTMAFIAMLDEDHPEFIFYRNPGADMLLRQDELDEALLRSTKVFHFGSLSLIHEPSRSATLKAVEIARGGGALISFDVNYRPTLWKGPQEAIDVTVGALSHVDLVKVNEIEAALLSGWERVEIEEKSLGDVARHILHYGPRVCVITLGPDGSYYHTAEAGEHVPGFKVDTVDATGCGDAFIAGLLCKLIAEGGWQDRLTPVHLREALVYANAVGALTALKLGVIPALPTTERVETFLGAQS